MKQLILIIQLILGSTLASWAEPTEPAAAKVRTLKEAFAFALITSERIAISDQSLRAAEALYRQTIGLSLPEFTYQHNSFWQQNTNTFGGHQSEGMFRIASTDLTGYRELAAIKAGKSAIRESEHIRVRVEQLLLSDLSGAFFGLLQSKENVASTRQLIEFGEKRSQELNERVRVGRAREAEAIEQESQIINLKSQLEEAVRIEDAHADLLAYLVGVPVTDPYFNEPDLLAEPEPLQSYLGKLRNRPDIKAAQEAVDITAAQVKMARANYFPQFGITGNYYTYRPDSIEVVNWDASLNIGVPLWTWGANRGSVDAAQSALAQADEALKALLRQADLEIRNAHRDFLSAQKQRNYQQKAIELARRDYRLQVRDDGLGLVTNIEVLASLNLLNNAELAFNNSRLNLRLAALHLEIAAGAEAKEILK